MKEWMIYDKKKEDFKLVRSRTWKKAIKRGAELGYKPRYVNDIRPRIGDFDCPTSEEFKEFMGYD